MLQTASKEDVRPESFSRQQDPAGRPSRFVSSAHWEQSVPKDPQTWAVRCVDDKIKTIFFYVGRRSRDKFGK